MHTEALIYLLIDVVVFASVYRIKDENASEELVGGVCCSVVGQDIYVLAIARKEQYHKDSIGMLFSI